jgi:EAL domain-containing protein (putative c-di-GMP-specific phosphodiesterase class I)
MDQPSVLLALDASDPAPALAAALRDRSVAVRVVQDREQLRGALQEGAQLLVVDLARGLGAQTGPEALNLLCELVRSAGGRSVIVTSHPGAPIEALLAAGAADVLEVNTSLSLSAHRIQGHLRMAQAPPQAAAEPDDFMGRLGDRLERARERETQVPVLVVRVPGRDGRPLEDVHVALQEASDHLERTTELAVSSARAQTLAVGDDGVAVFASELTRVQDAARFATALRAALSRRVGSHVHIGVACSPSDGSDADTLVKHALAASRRALRDGQGEIVFHSEAMGRWAFERLTLEASLRNALQNGELVLYYQPRVDIETQEIRGMEALLRWIHPQFGLVSPGQFIPLAEETGLIVPIGEWIVGEAARQNKEWRDAGLPPIRVSVNLSPVQFRRADLFDQIAAVVRSSGLEPSGLELEVTESLLMNDPTQTAEVLRRFKGLGLKLSIDDFGTGYSSLSYLKRFPIDALKIDRSFVTDVTSNPDDAAIATAIILMGHSLKLKVVAEGVETENQLAFLRVLQCNEAQGYLFSPPVPADRAAALLDARAVKCRPL